MRPKPAKNQNLLLSARLEQILNPNHPLFKLADAIDWTEFEEAFGRLYHGNLMYTELVEFFERQGMQDPVSFDSDWLLVGHVDEFMSIIPDAGGNYGWKVLLADPSLGVNLLTSISDLHIPKYYADYKINSTYGLLLKDLVVATIESTKINAKVHPARGLWTCIPHLVSDHPVFEGLPVNCVMRNVYENIWPMDTLRDLTGTDDMEFKTLVASIGFDWFSEGHKMQYSGPGDA